MLRFLDIHTIAFNVLGYPMSYVEFWGTLFSIASVWLVARNNIATWPVGNIGGVLFLALFLQIQLYSDALEQVFYLFTNFYGWYQWAKGQRGGEPMPIRLSSPRTIGGVVVLTALLSLLMGYQASQLHLLWPLVFAAPASYPYVDALTTVMSFSATFLMAHKKLECWIYWIIVDVIGIWLYFVKDVKFVALLYVVFLVLATSGLLSWRRQRTA